MILIVALNFVVDHSDFTSGHIFSLDYLFVFFEKKIRRRFIKCSLKINIRPVYIITIYSPETDTTVFHGRERYLFFSNRKNYNYSYKSVTNAFEHLFFHPLIELSKSTGFAVNLAAQSLNKIPFKF